MSKLRPIDCAETPVVADRLSYHERSKLVALFKALSDETRLEIFRLIASQPLPICVCDIVDQFSVTQPTISHHLKTLREANLISVSHRANWSFYSADPVGLQLLRSSSAAITSEQATVP